MNLLFLGKRRKIEKAITKGDLGMAEAILNAYSRDVWSSEYHLARLKVILDRAKIKQRIEKLTNNYQLEEARKILEEERRTGLLVSEEFKSLEEKVDGVTEEGMFARIQKSSGEEKIILAEKYVSLYPESNNRERAVQELLVEEFSLFANNLKTTRDFNEFYEKITQLNTVLEKYSGEKINLTGRIPLKEIVEKAKETEKHLSGGEGDDLVVGSWVKIMAVPGNLGWKDEYKAQRDATFPIGSVGKLITIIAFKYIVEFEGVTKYAWITGWTPDDVFWAKNGKKNVGCYFEEELIPVKMLNEVDIHKLRKEIERFETTINKNYSSNQEPVKKRHNPEITQQDKVLPRSDYQ